MKSNLKKNLGYQTIYQILNTCLPLITAPYLARVLGPSQLGVYSYVTSISGYFSLFAMLGIVNYGTRTIAACSGDEYQISKNFKEIFIIQIVSASICLLLYGFFILTFCKENLLLFIIQGISVFGCLIDINWFFFGLEAFRITVTRNLFIRIATVILIMFLVKNENDLWIYALLMVGSTLFSQVVLWGYFPKRVVRINEKPTLSKHLKPLFVLFIPLLALSVYHLMDKTMLGLLSSYEQSGFYYNADKVINIPIGVLTGVGTVMLPRITSLINDGEIGKSNILFCRSIEGIMAASVAIACGISAIAKEFTPFFFGSGYDDCVCLIIVLSPVLLIKSLSSTVRNEYLIPHNKDKCFVWSVALGACVNLLVNIALIPSLGALGAVVGTLTAELAACIWQYVSIQNDVNCLPVMIKSLVYVVFGFIMFGIVRASAVLLKCLPAYISLVAEIVVGIIVYGSLCIIYWRISKSDFFHLLINKDK